MCLLSVIIPVYNVQDWLDECIQSILTSAGDAVHQIELLLVNDGSTDQSGSICKRYAAGCQMIRAFDKDNGGVSSARNYGIERARGRYIAWVDPDDFVSGDWFGSIKEAIDQGEPDVIVMDSVRFSNESNKQEVYGRSGGFIQKDLFYEDVIRDVRMLSGLPNKVMKAELFRGIRFREDLKILEDYDAMPDILSRAKTVYYIPECLYYYRQHTGSLLHRETAELTFRSVEIALWRLQKVPGRFRAAAVTAAARQAFLYGWNQYANPKFGAAEEQLQFCIGFVRKHLGILCRDRELSIRMRVKLCVYAAGIYRLFADKRVK